MSEKIFYSCKHCGNLLNSITNSGVPIICCGEPMESLRANTMEAATEKHIPEVSVDGRLIHAKVGSVPHPMTVEHHIEFVYLRTENGGQIRHIKVGGEAQAIFSIVDDKPLEMFSYCNLHGLWKVEIPCDCNCDCKDTVAEYDREDDTICSAEFYDGCI